MKNNIKEDIMGNNTQNGASININKKDLADPLIQRNLTKMKGTNINVVGEETINEIPVRLKYLSNIKDSVNGEISKPFTVKGKNYQMVRAISPTKEKVNGVYCLDEVDESGEHIVHPVDYFEKNIINGQEATSLQEETNTTEKKEAELTSPKLGEFKYFFVNKKTGKIRKFKTSEEVAKANMMDGESFMSLTQFKKYVDSALFGSKKKGDLNEMLDEEQSPEDIHNKAKVLMNLISKKIPSSVIASIKTNKIAQKEVILAFSELVGVPTNLLNQIIGDMKTLAKTQTTDSVTATDGTGLKFEGRVVKKTDIIKEALK